MGTTSSRATRIENMPEDLRQCPRTKLALSPLGHDDASEAVGVMARSFAGGKGMPGEASFLWCVGNNQSEAERVEFISWYMKWSFYVCLRYGTSLGVRDEDGRLRGVCCALPPGKLHCTRTENSFAPHFLLTCIKMGSGPPTRPRGGTKRVEEMGKLMEALRLECVTQECWYVWVLAVDPGVQGTGCGGFLLQSLAWLADNDGPGPTQIWLETNGERNRKFYEKKGYVVLRERCLSSVSSKCDEKVVEETGDGGDLCMFGMMRQPNLKPKS